MKKTFIILAALAGSVLTAADCRAQATSISPFPDMEIECLGTELDGTETPGVQGKGSSKSDAIEQAKKNAVYAVIFQGIRNGADKGCDMRPLVTEVNAREKYEEYFDRFFKDGGDYSKYVTKEDEKKRSKDKVKTKTYVVRVITVRVLRTQLKNRLKGDGIIK